MSAKKKSAGKSKAAKRAKPAKAPKKLAKSAKGAKVAKSAKAKASPAKGRAAAKKPVAKKALKAKPIANKPLSKKSAKAKPALKAKAAPRPKPLAKAKRANVAVKRRDGAGHLDPKYAAELRARSGDQRKDDDRAFGGDALSQELGEEFVETVTSGEDEGNEIRDQRVTEELGGPFTVTTAGTEFAGDVDGSNPKGASREPFPRT